MLRIAAAVAGFLTATGASTAFGADASAPDPVSLDYVAHRLAASGQHLRTIQPQGNAYIADIVDRDGRICTVTLSPEGKRISVEPVTATSCRTDPAPAKALSASVVIQLAAAAGYPGIAALDFRNGAYRASGTDVEGRPVTLSIDPIGGRVLTAERQERRLVTQ